MSPSRERWAEQLPLPLRTLIWGADPDEFSSIPGYALDMAVDDPRTRRELEALAFGRAVTPEDQAAAARASQELRALDERTSVARARVAGIPAVPVPGAGGARRAAAIGAGAVSGPVMVEVVDDSQALRDDAWGAGPGRITESLRRFWVVPVIVASLALGAVGGSVATRAAEKPPVSRAAVAQSTAPSAGGWDTGSPEDPAVVLPDPAASDQSGDSAAVPISDAAALVSAEAWLSQPQQPADIFPKKSSLTALEADPASTHFVTSDTAVSIWVVRGKSNSLCLAMLAASDGSFELSCTPKEQFSAIGVSVGTPDGASAHWDANGVDYGFGPSGSTG